MPIELQHVTHTYAAANRKRGSKAATQPPAAPALDDVSLRIEDGELLAVIGHTGSGKSTLIRHLNGLLQPTSGRVLVDGLDLSQRAGRKAARRIVGMAFQYPEHQLFAPTVREDVAFGPRNMGLEPDEVDARVKDALEQLGVDYDEFADKSPFELSGGQQRRVALAGIIASHPRILVLDEPTAGLDPRGRAQVMDVVNRSHGQGATVVMVTHNMDAAAQFADRVVVLDHGRVFLEGAPQEVFSHATDLRRIGLGVPRAAKFAAELREHGLDLPQGIITLDALADALAAHIGPRTREQYRALIEQEPGTCSTKGGDGA